MHVHKYLWQYLLYGDHEVFVVKAQLPHILVY